MRLQSSDMHTTSASIHRFASRISLSRDTVAVAITRLISFQWSSHIHDQRLKVTNLKTLSTLIVAAVDITESLRVAGGELGGGDLGFEEAEVATANATAAVDVLLLNHRSQSEHTAFVIDDTVNLYLRPDNVLIMVCSVVKSETEMKR